LRFLDFFGSGFIGSGSSSCVVERLAFDRDDGVASTTRGRSREHDDGIAVVSGRSNRRDRVDGVARDATAATAVSLSATPR